MTLDKCFVLFSKYIKFFHLPFLDAFGIYIADGTFLMGNQLTGIPALPV